MRESRAAARIAIVGGGFTGATLAVHLARAAAGSLAIDIFEPRDSIGAGVAYGSCGPEHRINVPSDRMSVFAEDPLHFSRWLRDCEVWDADRQALTPQGEHYSKRHDFGAYMADLVGKAAAGNPSGSIIRHRRAAVLEVREKRNALEVVSERGIDTYEHAVLCASHAAPAFRWPVSEAATTLPHLVRNPWRQDQLASVPREAAVFVIGTGLTMADVIVTLRGHGHRGSIHAVSRRGLTPMPHAAFDDGFDLFGSAVPPTTAMTLLQFVRRRVREAERQEMTWHAVVDALRRKLATYWSTLPIGERAKIARSLRAYWDVHRFRMAPQVAALLEEGRTEGWLRISSGRVDSIGRDGDRFAIHWRARGDATCNEAAEAIVNCTGPDSDLGRSALPVVRALIDRGTIRADALRIGFDVDAQGRLFDRSGQPNARLWAAGPLARSVVGEATGVPEASQHARVVAEAVAAAVNETARVHSYPGEAT